MSNYYYENSITTILSQEGREIIDQELEKLKPCCASCGKSLFRLSMLEGDCLTCSSEIYTHLNFWKIVKSDIPSIQYIPLGSLNE